MAQTRTHALSELPTIVGVPATVVFRSRACDWNVKRAKYWISRDGKTVRPGALYDKAGDYLAGKYFDPWAVRARFFALQTDEEILEFLNLTGAFTNKNYRGWWTYDHFRLWQAVLRELLRRHPSRWRAWVEKHLRTERLMINALNDFMKFQVSFRWKGKKHFAVFEAGETLGAMLATIIVDHLRGAKYAFCARADCRKPFEVKTKHGKQYCRTYCAHLAGLRRRRAERARSG